MIRKREKEREIFSLFLLVTFFNFLPKVTNIKHLSSIWSIASYILRCISFSSSLCNICFTHQWIILTSTYSSSSSSGSVFSLQLFPPLTVFQPPCLQLNILIDIFSHWIKCKILQLNLNLIINFPWSFRIYSRLSIVSNRLN